MEDSAIGAGALCVSVSGTGSAVANCIVTEAVSVSGSGLVTSLVSAIGAGKYLKSSLEAGGSYVNTGIERVALCGNLITNVLTAADGTCVYGIAAEYAVTLIGGYGNEVVLGVVIGKNGKLVADVLTAEKGGNTVTDILVGAVNSLVVEAVGVLARVEIDIIYSEGALALVSHSDLEASELNSGIVIANVRNGTEACKLIININLIQLICVVNEETYLDSVCEIILIESVYGTVKSIDGLGIAIICKEGHRLIELILNTLEDVEVAGLLSVKVELTLNDVGVVHKVLDLGIKENTEIGLTGVVSGTADGKNGVIGSLYGLVLGSILRSTDVYGHSLVAQVGSVTLHVELKSEKLLGGYRAADTLSDSGVAVCKTYVVNVLVTEGRSGKDLYLICLRSADLIIRTVGDGVSVLSTGCVLEIDLKSTVVSVSGGLRRNVLLYLVAVLTLTDTYLRIRAGTLLFDLSLRLILLILPLMLSVSAVIFFFIVLTGRKGEDKRREDHQENQQKRK
jgi:hypothetical protein